MNASTANLTPSPRWKRLWQSFAARLGCSPGRNIPTHLQLGRKGEQLAAAYLKRQQFRVLARNFVTPVGEVDLVAESHDRSIRVVVEVKSRSASRG